MGDLMHALPALTEAEQNIKNISFDWVVDKAFSSVPGWHPAVDKIIKTDHRNWKKQLFSSESREALKLVKKEINATDYDFVVDIKITLRVLSCHCFQITGLLEWMRAVPGNIQHIGRILIKLISTRAYMP